jgi:hypothetical protein
MPGSGSSLRITFKQTTADMSLFYKSARSLHTSYKGITTSNLKVLQGMKLIQNFDRKNKVGTQYQKPIFPYKLTKALKNSGVLCS